MDGGRGRCGRQGSIDGMGGLRTSGACNQLSVKLDNSIGGTVTRNSTKMGHLCIRERSELRLFKVLTRSHWILDTTRDRFRNREW